MDELPDASFSYHARKKNKQFRSLYGYMYSERVMVQFMGVGYWAGVTYFPLHMHGADESK